jgi:hypothetical protein
MRGGGLQVKNEKSEPGFIAETQSAGGPKARLPGFSEASGRLFSGRPRLEGHEAH